MRGRALITTAAVVLATAPLGLAGCAAGSVGAARPAPTPSRTATATGTATPTTDPALDPTTVLDRAASALTDAGVVYTSAQDYLWGTEDRPGLHETWLDRRHHRFRSRTDYPGVVVDVLVLADGEAYLRTDKLQGHWVDLPPGRTTTPLEQLAQSARTEARRSPVPGVTLVWAGNRFLDGGADTVDGDPTRLLRGTVDVVATREQPGLSAATRAMLEHAPDQFRVELEVDRHGIIRHYEQSASGITLTTTTRVISAGHHFDRPPRSLVVPESAVTLPGRHA